jgi:hypothetical protein
LNNGNEQVNKITLIFKIYYSYHQLDFPWSSEVDQVRTEIFKIDSFRQWQLETINVTLSNHDCILIMPTGGGKSLCYQLPGIISNGKTILHRFQFKKKLNILRYNSCCFTINISCRRSNIFIKKFKY